MEQALLKVSAQYWYNNYSFMLLCQDFLVIIILIIIIIVP